MVLHAYNMFNAKGIELKHADDRVVQIIIVY